MDIGDIYLVGMFSLFIVALITCFVEAIICKVKQFNGQKCEYQFYFIAILLIATVWPLVISTLSIFYIGRISVVSIARIINKQKITSEDLSFYAFLRELKKLDDNSDLP